MKKAKRALALALVFALVASFCVTGAAAEPGQGEQPQNIVYGSYDNGNWTHTEGGNGSYTDSTSGVKVSKTAVATSAENQYKVTLKVEVPVMTGTKSNSAATVLVIDRSNSMGYCEKCGGSYWHERGCDWENRVITEQTRLHAAQQAACTFLDNYRDETSTAPRYVAVVAFAGRNGTSTVVDWMNVNDEQGLARAKEEINDLQLKSSTNLNAGLEEAEDLLNNNDIRDVPSGNRYVIALTDGAPTTEEADAIETASNIKNGATIYTVCFGASDEKVSWGGGWGSPGYDMFVSEYLRDKIATQPKQGSEDTYAFDAADADELYAAFEALTEDIESSLERLTVTDPMADGVTLNTDFTDDSVSVVNDDTITWGLNNGERDGNTITYTLTYTVTVNPDNFKDQKAGYYPLNGETCLTIPDTDGQTGGTVQFPVPGVFVTPTSSTEEQNVYVYVELVDENGKPLQGDALAEAIQDVKDAGLDTINANGYFTIGYLTGVKIIPVADATPDDDYYSQYANVIAAQWSTLANNRYEPNEEFKLTANDLTGSYLHVANGADTAAGDKPYVESVQDGYNTWHLDVPVTIDEFLDQTVTVTYTDGVDDEVVFADQVYDRIPGTATPAFNGTPTRNGFTFNGWQSSIDGQVYSADELANMTVPNKDVTYTATWTKNTSSITIEVYVDGEPVTLTEENLSDYITELTDGANTPTWEDTVEDGVIKGTYNYQNYDSADIVLTPNGKYVLQGIKGTFIKGETAWTGITTPSGTAWNIDNVMGGTTLSVYLNTKYSVEYEVPSGFTAPKEDDNTYITVEGLQDVSEPSFGSDIGPNEGVSGGWTNNNLETTINLKTVPTGTTGWYDELTPTAGQHAEGETIIVAEAVADGLNGIDNTFTFSATANQYKVTYDANATDATGTTADNNTYTYDETVTVLENGFTYAGHTFIEWNTQANGSGTAYQPNETFEIEEDTTLYAQWKEITGTLTVTKTVEGLEGNDTLPDAFAITVSGTSGAAYDDSYTLTIGVSDDENIEYSYDTTSGTHQWVISGAALGAYNVTEDNYDDVSGYTFDSAQSTTSAEATLTEGETVAATAALKNVYIKDEPGLSVEKTVYSVGDATGADIPSEVKVGDVIVYKIVVKNTGNVPLTNISVTDTLGESELMLYTDAACTTPAATFDLDVNETEELYATYTVQAADAGKALTNTATAEDEDGTEDSGEVTVNVTPQYKVDVVYHYDTVDGPIFTPPSGTQTVFIYDTGEDWNIGTVPEKVSNNGENYIFDESRSDDTSGTNISSSFTVNLVYVKDEWKDGDREDPKEEDDDEGGDGTPDYKQARILYEVAEGQDKMGGVSPAIDVVTLTDDDGDGEYSGSVPAESTATPEDGSVFVSWSGNGYSPEVQTNELSHEFTAVGGETYTYTASFKTGTTDAEVTKTLVSYTRDGVTVDEIPEGFKARVGDVLNYKITIKNTGEIALEDVTVSDTLWGNGVASAMVGETDTDVSGGSCTVNVASGSSVTITYSYTVQADDIGQTITNTATVDLPNVDPEDDPKDEEEVTVDEYGITVTPADITIYMGGDAGYEAVVGENGQVISDNNTLPTPLFTVELSESFGELSVEQIEAIEIAGTTSDAGTRGWRFDYAGKAEDGTDLYYIVPDAGQEPIRVTYTDGEGNAAVSDHFDPATIDELFAEFAIELYTGTVTSVTAEVNGITCKIDYSGTGTLTVRAVDDTDENPVVGVQEALPRPVEAGEGAVTAPAGTTYTLNETTVAADAAGVGLLFDGIIDDGADRTGALLAELESELGVTVEDGNYQAQYLDLVDAHNGNAWVKASGAVTVYWGYPEGTGEDTDFALYHFEGLHREGTNSGFDIEDVATSDIERVTITKTANGIAFDIGSGGFSPFVLVWDDGDGGDEPWWPPIDPGDDGDEGDDGGDGEFVPKWLNIDDHYAYIIGYEDGTVRPQGNITRAEVATIFFRLLTDEVREEYWSTESGYSDVSSSDWYNNAISTLSNLGVITGYEDGTFRPNASISRAEFVTIVTRFFDYTAEYEGTFSDVSYSSWYADFVQAAVDMGLVNGYENGTFRPNASITRAEAVAIVNRVLLRRPDAEHLLPWSAMNTFSDNVLESAWYYEDIQEATNSHDYEWLKSGVEDWTKKLPERDWAALEREWSKAYDAPGGEVTA